MTIKFLQVSRYLIVTVLIFSFTKKLLAQEEPEIEVGGALRFNYNLSSWKESQKDRGGDFGYDLFRLNVNGAYKGVYIDAEYRFYSELFGGSFLKHGVFGYQIDEERKVEIGLAKVPFGIERYNSHNFFLNLPYYVGLEDDHDMGVTYTFKDDWWEYHFGFFKNAEELRFGNNTELSPSRYSYDVMGRNKEINQGNVKLIYKPAGTPKHKIGFSGKYGALYNLDTEETGDRYAIALHYEYKNEDWFIKAQALKAGFNPENADGEARNIIQMGAFGAPYEVASNFEIYNIGISRIFDTDVKLLEHIELYNDFGFMRKNEDSFENSFMNVTGILINSGFIYTYIDYAAGYNHSWLGGNYVDDFSTGNPDAKWEARFNINIGYYF